jgi:flagellin
VLDMAAAVYWGASSKVNVFLSNTQEVTTTARLNICTRAGALDAMGTIDATLQRISSELGAIGSTQSRFAVTLNTLASSRENFAAAAGRIMDADVAEESANLTRTQILQQAGAAVLAQANLQPSLALQLLRG